VGPRADCLKYPWVNETPIVATLPVSVSESRFDLAVLIPARGRRVPKRRSQALAIQADELPFQWPALWSKQVGSANWELGHCWRKAEGPSMLANRHGLQSGLAQAQS